MKKKLLLLSIVIIITNLNAQFLKDISIAELAAIDKKNSISEAYIEGKILIAQKENEKVEVNEENEEKKPIMTFDDTKDSPVIYGKDLQIPAFIRRQHD